MTTVSTRRMPVLARFFNALRISYQRWRITCAEADVAFLEADAELIPVALQFARADIQAMRVDLARLEAQG